MSAKEMFEKLNYFQSSADGEDELVYNLNSKDIENYRYISFHLILKYIEMDDWTDNFQLSIQELQAINKQVEELNWFVEEKYPCHHGVDFVRVDKSENVEEVEE